MATYIHIGENRKGYSNNNATRALKSDTKTCEYREVSAYRRRTLQKLVREIECPNSDHTWNEPKEIRIVPAPKGAHCRDSLSKK